MLRTTLCFDEERAWGQVLCFPNCLGEGGFCEVGSGRGGKKSPSLKTSTTERR